MNKKECICHELMKEVCEKTGLKFKPYYSIHGDCYESSENYCHSALRAVFDIEIVRNGNKITYTLVNEGLNKR